MHGVTNAALQTSETYRPDVDGLRAVAVVPVVLFHAGLGAFSGGFVGVDVFFVISGFLITRILAHRIEEGKFSLIWFYERRIRRIFPALITVLMFTMAAGYLLFTPTDFEKLSLSTIAAILFGSNFFFWRSTNYFANAADAEPLLHTWSLAVEEQFYIFYPLLLFALYRSRISKEKALVALLLLSFIVSVVSVFDKQSATFYLLPTRAWELLVGGVLALNMVPRPSGPTARSAAGWLGLALILIPVLIYTKQTVFPGLAALPPVLGTALVIWSGTGAQSGAHRLLSSRHFLHVGQASYSLYLWHFPLLAFGAYAFAGHLPLAAALALCLVALAISFLSLRYVEQPFRIHRSKRAARMAVVGLPVAGMAVIGLTAWGVYQLQGMPSRLNPVAARMLAAEEDQYRHPRQCMSVGDVIVPPDRACHLGTAGVRPSALLWGDSHAMVTATAMERSALRAGKAFYFAAAADCPVGIGFEIAATTELTRSPSYRYCATYNREMLRMAVEDERITTVVLSSRWTNWRLDEPNNPAEPSVEISLHDQAGAATDPRGNERIFKRGFIALLAELRNAGKKVYVVGPLPEPEYNVPQVLYLNQLGAGPPVTDLPLSQFRVRHRKILRILADAERDGLATIIRPETILCRSGGCPIIVDGTPMYMDHNHLSVEGAHRTAALYDPVFSE